MESAPQILTELKVIRRICEDLQAKVYALEAQKRSQTQNKERMIEKRMMIKYERQKKKHDKNSYISTHFAQNLEPFPSFGEWMKHKKPARTDP